MKWVKDVITSELVFPGIPYMVMMQEWWSTMKKKLLHLEEGVIPLGLGLGIVSRYSVWSGLSGGVTLCFDLVAILWLAMGHVMHLLMISGWATTSAYTPWSLAVRRPLMERWPSRSCSTLMFTLEGLDVLMTQAVEISFGGGRVSVVPVGNWSKYHEY